MSGELRVPFEWFWIPLGVLSVLALYQQFRIFQIERQNRKREELFKIVTENAADMIALVDVKGRRLYNSPAYKRVLGYTAEELGETSSFEQIHADDRFKVLEAARIARQTGVGQRLEYRIKHKNGNWRVLESVASTIRDAKGQVSKLVIVNRDITDRKLAQEQLEHNLFHDSLTGLPNRRLFLDRLGTVFTAARREPSRCYAVLLANLDRFKEFNEIVGTSTGDQVLAEISRRLASHLRQTDTLARHEASGTSGLFRVGGDEFTILLEPIRDPSDALRVARRIQEVIAKPFTIDSRETRVSASIGIALSTAAHESPEDVLKDADAAMRRAKSLGGSRSEVFDEAMHSRAVGRLRLESDLRIALAEAQFRVHYQPVVELATRRIVSFEALLRWQHPQQGLISPYRFIEAAENSGILVSIGQWVILQVCRQLQEWQSNATANAPTITLNVSARQFADARLVNDLQEALQQTRIDPSRLQLEISEDVAAADPKLTITVLSHLKHMGIGVILDDFGTGSTSLRGLREFPLDALKIDLGLIREMQSDRVIADIVELIIALAHKMKLRVIAEGIENARQIENLLKLGCEYGQGFYFSQPLDAMGAQRFLQQQVSSTRGVGA